MKIGILTFHRADNFGAVLQCYALQEVLRSNKHDVRIIDYRNPHIERVYSGEFDFKQFVKIVLKKGLFCYCKSFINRKLARKKFDSFRLNSLSISNISNVTEVFDGYDAIVIGSDQMWTVSCHGSGVDDFYFGKLPLDKKCKMFGYAISSNCDFFKFLDIQAIRDIVYRYEKISFREEKVSDLINVITGVESTVTLDPTLLLDSNDWSNLIDHSWAAKKYVVTYQVRRSSKNPYRIDEIAKKYANKHGCRVIELYGNEYGPIEFVSAIKYAKAVFTSSFHATVFSIIFAVPFYSFCLKDGSDERYVSLLHLMNMEAHLKDLTDDCEELLQVNLDERDRDLEKIKLKSLKFIGEIS